MNQCELIKINQNHIKRIDKLYRMHGGLSSMLIDFKNNSIKLKIATTKRWKKNNISTAKQLATCWKDCNIELSNATNFIAQIHITSSRNRFVINTKNNLIKNDLGQKVKFIGKIDNELTFVETIRGNI